MSISSAISIAVAGLQLNQQESALTAQNIGSASQPGYTRKMLVTNDQVTATGLIGISTTVQRYVDDELQKQLISSTSKNSYNSTMADYATNIDQMFGTPGGTNTLETTLTNFNSALSNLVTSPSDNSIRLSVISSAQELAQQLNQTSENVQQLRTQADGAIADAVGQINSLTSGISELNEKIISGRAAGQDITNLEDQRDENVRQLATYVDINTREDTNGSLSVFTPSGLSLVDRTANQLTFSQSGVLSPQSQWSADQSTSSLGTITVGTGANTTDVIASGLIRSGSLAALINMRDVTLPKAQNQLDDLAASLSSSLSDTTATGTAVTAGSDTGYSVDLTGLQSGDRINMSYVDAAGLTKNITLVPVASASDLPVPQAASADPTATVIGYDNSTGISGAITALQTALGAKFNVSNPSGNALQITNVAGAGAVTIKSLSAQITTTATQNGTGALALFTVGQNGPVYTGAYTVNGSQKLGLSSVLTVNQSVLDDPSLLVKSTSSTLDGDPTRPQALLDQFNSAQFTYGPETGIVTGKNSFQTSITDFANQMTAYWGQVDSDASTAKSSQSVIQTNLQARYTSTSSVSIDSELAQLVQIQSAYAANARVMTIAQSMLQALEQIPV
ncbi:MAG: flagellar hook-associated protein FlgK [Ancalomicrobiaceae bacterium]|nr:flagellar hook-associated protein FlgK [Ancalomicrobiaceae bacterium]